MSKEVQMTFRVESALRNHFTEAVRSQHLPAGQVLRQLMREYIERVRSNNPHDAFIGADSERKEREKSVRAAQASVELEGFTISKECKNQAQRFVNGEITIDEMITGLDRYYE